MKVKRKLSVAIMLFLMLLYVGVVVKEGQMAQAAGNKAGKSSSKTEALSLYKKALEKGEIAYEKDGDTGTTSMKAFCLVDIDKNGIPELVIKDTEEGGYGGGTRYVYTVKGKKIKACGDFFQKGDGNELQYYSKHKSISYWWWTNGVGGAGSALCKLKNFKLKPYKSIWSGQVSPESAKMIYQYGNGAKSMKKISKKKYDGLAKKYFDKKDCKTYKFHNNTEKNREKYLK